MANKIAPTSNIAANTAPIDITMAHTIASPIIAGKKAKCISPNIGILLSKPAYPASEDVVYRNEQNFSFFFFDSGFRGGGEREQATKQFFASGTGVLGVPP